MAFGKLEKRELLSASSSLWVDVRDVAQAHVAAAEKKEAANKRFFIVAGFFSNGEIVDIVRKEFPDLAKNLPDTDASAAANGSPDGLFSLDVLALSTPRANYFLRVRDVWIRQLERKGGAWGQISRLPGILSRYDQEPAGRFVDSFST